MCTMLVAPRLNNQTRFRSPTCGTPVTCGTTSNRSSPQPCAMYRYSKKYIKQITKHILAAARVHTGHSGSRPAMFGALALSLTMNTTSPPDKTVSTPSAVDANKNGSLSWHIASHASVGAGTLRHCLSLGSPGGPGGRRRGQRSGPRGSQRSGEHAGHRCRSQ
ncbi:unnamed protein product [Prorocentrum cordatum]|uniref:Uncharacterized protein n=1 Tax=Prorocentrum cordatum TaxID=2364126 RepID=A0ABN9ST06_9DINO|nr:unnamed protein product [Polarella glacialis]